MKLLGTVLGVLFLMTTAAPVFAASVKSDYQKDFDFRKSHTFAFKTERASNDRLATNTIEAEVESSPFGYGPGFGPSFGRGFGVKRFLSDTRKLEKQNG